MKGLYEGGQCNTNAIGATSNQFKRMMNGLAMGGNNPERVMEYGAQGQSFEGHILERERMFQSMNKAWGSSEAQVQALEHQMQMMMGGQFDRSRQQYEEQMRMMQEQQWIEAQKQHAQREHAMSMEFENAQMQSEAERWRNEMQMQEGFDKATVSKEEEQKSIINSTDKMLDVMLNDTDPRFQNSQFLNFLKKIKNQQIVIEGKQIREVSLNQAAMESAWQAGQNMHQETMKTMKDRLREAEILRAEESMKNNLSFDEHWQKKIEDYEKQYENREGFEEMLEQKYMQVLKEMNLDLNEAWRSASDLEQELVHGTLREEYAYSKNNPYEKAVDKKAIALELINKGQNNQAILALQAYTAEQPEDSEGWRILGRILQENDQDQKSITCFLNSIKFNPENLDSLLSLGVSCTNVLDEVKAMNFLKRWIILNPKYKHLNVDPNIIPEEETGYYTYKIQDIKMANEKMIAVFENALLTSGNDPELFNSLAILFFIKRDYERAIDLFKRALELDPTNYLLMNKVGATLAHLGRADEAINFYHNALNVRPNYVRVWTNLGIAYGFKGDYEEAARLYLNALSLRPDAKHIWTYLHTTFMNMQRYDLIKLISEMNPRLFAEFDIIALSDLPEPDIEYTITTERHILNKDSNDWLKEFKNEQK